MTFVRSLCAVILLLALHCSGAEAINSDLVSVIAASCVSFLLFCVVVTFIVFAFSWSKWYNSWMGQKGRVLMPKEYFRKKEEMRRRLLASSATPSIRSNRGPPVPLVAGPPVGVARTSVDRGSWVHGWDQNSPRGMETLDATIVLGDEKDEEYKIETVLVDNEVLDVGPYKNDHSAEQPVKGDVYSVPYIFKVGDKTDNGAEPKQIVQTTSEGEATRVLVTSPSANGGATLLTSAGEISEAPDPYNYSTIGEVKRSIAIDDTFIKL